MSELSREQVEATVKKLQSGSPFLHQGNYLLKHDAAIRAKLEAMTQENRTLKACQCDGCSERLEDADAFCLKCFQKIKQQLAEAQATVTAQREEAQKKLEAMRQENIVARNLTGMATEQLAASEERFQAAENERIEWVQRGERAEQQLAEAQATVTAQQEEIGRLTERGKKAEALVLILGVGRNKKRLASGKEAT